MNARLTMPLSPSNSLRTRFALVMGVTGLFFGILVTGYLEWRLEHNTVESVRHTLKATADETANRLANDLATRKREIELMGSLLGQAGLSEPARIRALLDKLKERQPSYAWIGLMDAAGKVRAASGGLLEGNNVAARPWFSGALQGTYLGDPHDAKLLAEFIGPSPDGAPARFVDVAIPLRNAQGQVEGVLAAHLHWDWVKTVVAEILNEQDDHAPLQVLIADRQGTLLLKPYNEKSTTLSEVLPATDAPSAFLSARADGVADDLSAGLGWTVLTRLDMQHVEAPVREARNWMVVLCLSMGMAFVWVTWLFSGHIARPIRKLAEQAREFDPEAGQPFLSEVAHRSDEVGVLATVMGDFVNNLLTHAGRTRLFIEHAPVPLAIFDTEMRYVAVSQRWLADFGLTGRNLVGQSHYAIFPEIPEHWRRIHQRALAGEVLHSDCEQFERADGHSQWLRWEVRPWHTPAGAIGGIAIFTEEISARVAAERALESSRQRFAGIVSSAMDAIISCDTQGRIVLFNRAAETMFQTPADEALGSHVERFIPERFRARHAAHIAHFGEAGITNRAMGRLGEIFGLRADGEAFSIEAAISQITVDGEKLYTVILRDISERLAAEAALRKIDARFRATFEQAAVGIAHVALDGHWLDVNRKLCDIVGYSRDELLRCTFQDITHPEDLSKDLDNVARLLSGEIDQYQMEKRYLRKDGRVVWINLTVSLVRSVEGEPEYFVAVIEDIAARKDAERALQRSNDLLADYNANLSNEVATRTAELVAARNYFRDFVLRAPLPLCVVDAEGRIALRNEQFVSCFGYDETAVPTIVEWWERAYPDPRYRHWVLDTWSAAVKQAQLEQRAISPVEYQVSCADGQIRYMEISGVTLDRGLLATFVDVTARRKAETELQLRREEAESANQAKSDFLATMSHEIRTPMNAILGTVQILERSPLPAEQQQLVTTIRTAGRSLLALINDVLDLSKIEAGHFELDLRPFVLANVMSNLVDVFQASAGNKGLAISLEPLPENVPALLGDAYRLGQILHNLVSNAIKFTLQGRIVIAAAVLDDAPERVSLRFSVRDSGIGIAQAEIARLFMPFIQATAATGRQFGGTGLGLAICRQLVTLMKGEIGVTSKPNEGSEFWFAIPFEKVVDPPDAELGRREPASIGPRLAGLRLLVVDDSIVNLELAKRLLAFEGGECDTVNDGGPAVERLREQPEAYDAVLMDIQMPGMDGLEATRAIRKELGLVRLPIIALTAGALPSQRERASAVGMNDFLTKPFELDALVATVLRQVPAPRPRTRATKALPPATDDAAFPAIPGIDRARVSKRMCGDKALFFSALRALQREFSHIGDEARAAFRHGDRSSVARRMHKLRGVAGNLSADTVAALAGEIERIMNAGEEAQFEPTLDALDAALQTLLAGLPADLDRSPAPGEAASAASAENLQALREALAGFDMKALSLFSALRPQLAVSLGAHVAGTLTEAMEQLDFSSALRLLSNLDGDTQP